MNPETPQQRYERQMDEFREREQREYSLVKWALALLFIALVVGVGLENPALRYIGGIGLLLLFLPGGWLLASIHRCGSVHTRTRAWKEPCSA